MSEVRTLSGRKIDWANPPKANAKCSLVLLDSRGNDKKVVASFRSLCALNRMNNQAKRKYGESVRVFQGAFNNTVKLSAGTHDYDACFDLYIPGVSWWEQQRFFRSMGFGCWYRHAPLFGNHIHGFVLPKLKGGTANVSDDYRAASLKVGIYVDGGYSLHGKKTTSSQIEDYYHHAFGLSGQHDRNSDKSWYPADIEATIFNLRAYVQARAKKQLAA